MTHKKWCDLGDGAGSLFYLLTINAPSLVDVTRDISDENVSNDETVHQDRYVIHHKSNSQCIPII